MNTLHYVQCLAFHRVFNARRPMRIKATTTGLQAAERDTHREKGGIHRGGDSLKRKQIYSLCSCWLPQPILTETGCDI